MEIPDELDVDTLIPFMPGSVREEYYLNGDASIFGFSPLVKHWLETSTHPRVERWRNELRLFTARQCVAALKRQGKMIELSSQFPQTNGNGLVRRMTVPIDPFIKGWMEKKERHAFKDPDAIADTKRRHPKLFT